MSAAGPVRPALAAAALLAVAATGCGPAQPECGPATAVVARVVDGDTIELESGERIRYLLVNTPEITNGHDECFGQEGAQFNKDLVEGKQVSLAYDPASCTGKYGRTLAYVSVQGREVNRMLVERGYACVLYLSGPDGADGAGADRLVEFEDYQKLARAQNRGIWGACDPVPCL